MRIKWLIFVVLLQIVSITYLGVQISDKLFNKTTSISYIDKNSVNVKGIASLKYFYELKPEITKVVKKNWLEKEVVYTFNKDALNDRFDYEVEKPKNVFRIITLGDSFTFGEFVNTKDNWTEILEDELNNFHCKKISKYEVINLGVCGYDIEYAVERYRARGQKYNPDLIVWMLLDNIRLRELIQPYYEKCIGVYPTTTVNDKINHACSKTAREELLKTMGEDSINDLNVQEFNQIFDLFDKKIMAIDLNDHHKGILKKVNRQEQIDIYSYNVRNEKYKLLDGHPNQTGHQEIAKNVLNHLLKNELVPCN